MMSAMGTEIVANSRRADERSVIRRMKHFSFGAIRFAIDALQDLIISDFYTA